MTGLCIARAYLSERFWQALQCKLVVAELTVATVGSSEPLLQAGPVHHGQAARTLTRGEKLPRGPVFMADPTEWLLTAQTDTQNDISHRSPDGICVLW